MIIFVLYPVIFISKLLTICFNFLKITTNDSKLKKKKNKEIKNKMKYEMSKMEMLHQTLMRCKEMYLGHD